MHTYGKATNDRYDVFFRAGNGDTYIVTRVKHERHAILLVSVLNGGMSLNREDLKDLASWLT